MRRLFLLLFLTISTLQAAITIKVVNANRNFDTSHTYLRFESEPNNLVGSLNGAPLLAKHAYSFAELSQGIILEKNEGGRIFFSLGKPLNDPTTPPEANNDQISSYHTRFDKVELTYSDNNPYSVANLTTADFFAIPISLKTYKQGRLVNSLKFSVDGNTMIKNLSALTNHNPKVVIQENGQFLRVLAPSNIAASSAYCSMQVYLDIARKSNVPIQIVDDYFNHGDSPERQAQRYSFLGTFASNGDLLLHGGGDLIGYNHTIALTYTDLINNGIYGCNPPYLVDGNPQSIGDNNIYSAVVRDLVGGFNLGFIASTTINPLTQKSFQNSPSCDWKLASQAFEFLQSNKTCYNQWAQYIAEHSDSYGFPFSDLWRKVQLSLMDIDTLEVTIEADSQK